MRKSMSAELAEARADLKAEQKFRMAAEEAQRRAERVAEERTASIGLLKIALADALADAARLRGYVDRVHEQDDAQSDRVPVEVGQIHSLVPATRLARGEPAAPAYRDITGYGAERKVGAHWTAL